jgi:transposase
MGVFDRIFAALATEGGPPERLMIDSTHLKAHRTAASLRKRGAGSLPRPHQGRAEHDAPRRLRQSGAPRCPALTEGQASDHRGAALMLPKLPLAQEPIADRGYDSARFRAERAQRGIAACIPSTCFRKHPIPHDTALYQQRHRIEIMFGRLKDWRRIATRDDRCATIFLGAITLAATVIFWLGQ